MLSRRLAVQLSAKGVMGLMAAAPVLGGCLRKPQGRLRESPGSQATGAASNLGTVDWGRFIEELAELAEKQFSGAWDQEVHVTDVESLMRLLDLDDRRFADIYDGYVNAHGLFPEIRSAHDGGSFSVATIEFDAGDEIALHNHPDMTGVILCLSGAVEIESFDLLPNVGPDGKLRLQQVDQLRLTAGEFSTLTGRRGNIHGLVATEFTELLDVFTPPYAGERKKRFKWYERATEPLPGTNTFEAWER